MQEQLKATGKVNIVLTDENGNVKEERNVDNLVVTVGKNHLTAAALGYTGSIATKMGFMAVGTSAATPVAGDTLLTAEVGRVAATANQFQSTTLNDSIQYIATFPNGTGTGTLQEAGIFNVISANTPHMLCRTTFGAITKGASDSMTITWTVKLT